MKIRVACILGFGEETRSASEFLWELCFTNACLVIHESKTFNSKVDKGTIWCVLWDYTYILTDLTVVRAGIAHLV
jgi:hypothetical protein